MYGGIMPVMLQVRNLPDDVHAKLKERAVEARMSLSDFVARELAQLVRYHSNAEIFAAARVRAGESGVHRPDVAAAIHAERAERDKRWDEHLSSTPPPS